MVLDGKLLTVMPSQ